MLSKRLHLLRRRNDLSTFVLFVPQHHVNWRRQVVVGPILSAILDPARDKVSLFTASLDSASRWVVPPLGPPPYEPGFSPTIQSALPIPNLNRLNQHPYHPFVDNSWSLCNNVSARWLSRLAWLCWWYLPLTERTITSSDLLACGNWFRAGRFRFTAFYCGTINVSVRWANGCSGTTHEGYNV